MAGLVVVGGVAVAAWKIYRFFTDPPEEPPNPSEEEPSDLSEEEPSDPSEEEPSNPSEEEPPHSPSPPPSRSPFTWSKQEGYEATAAAFSLINGVKFISQKDVLKELQLGKKVKAVESKDVFYGQLSSYQNQEQLYCIPDSAYDPDYDYDFTNYKGDDTNCTRGGYPYKRPAGWNRKAVSVIGKYENDVWLGQDKWRDHSSPEEWAVSYHGTKIENVHNIITEGYDTKKCLRQFYGSGIYSMPDAKAAENYATDFDYKGETYKCILQNRVNLKKTKEHKTGLGTSFMTPDDKDIRPYGVCIKKI